MRPEPTHRVGLDADSRLEISRAFCSTTSLIRLLLRSSHDKGVYHVKSVYRKKKKREEQYEEEMRLG
jgi:hypothetical protein